MRLPKEFTIAAVRARRSVVWLQASVALLSPKCHPRVLSIGEGLAASAGDEREYGMVKMPRWDKRKRTKLQMRKMTVGVDGKSANECCWSPLSQCYSVCCNELLNIQFTRAWTCKEPPANNFNSLTAPGAIFFTLLSGERRVTAHTINKCVGHCFSLTNIMDRNAREGETLLFSNRANN